jgi:hypothetical protein
MTTTIHADGPLYVGPPYATASFNEFVTVLHVLVGAVFVLSGLVAMVAVAVMVFSGARGCGPSRASVIALPAMVVSFVTGASTTAWAAAGPDRGLLTLLAATGLVGAVGWCIAWRASYSAVSRDGAEGAPR